MRILTFIIFFSFTNFANASIITQIINNFESTKNMKFNFVQTINGKVEEGKCTLVYPKKIFCEYYNSKNKILVSNGKSLVIKTISSYYRYPLKKTSLNLILDKKFLIDKIYDLKERIIDNTYINYTIIENNNEINILFDNQTFNLIGWQTKDIYQNLNITFLSSIRINQLIAKNLFELPLQN